MGNFFPNLSLTGNRGAPIRQRIKEERTVNVCVEIVRIFRQSRPSHFEERPEMGQEDALLRLRTCPSCIKETPFLMQEGHVLKCSL